MGGKDKFTRRKFSELDSERLCCTEGDGVIVIFCSVHTYFISAEFSFTVCQLAFDCESCC